jgi:hypothetical protein
VSGSNVEFQTLSTTNGTWTGGTISSFSYQWQRCSGTCSNITGATSSQYTTGAADVGDTVQVVVTASNAGGSASDTSAPNETYADWSGNSRTATGLTPNGQAPLVNAQGGPISSAYSVDFQGSSYIQSVPSVSLSGSYTVEAWVKTTSSTTDMAVFGTRGPSDFSFDMQLVPKSIYAACPTTNCIHSDIGNGTSWLSTAADSNATFTYSTGTWYHLAEVVTPTSYTLYVNGVNVGSGTYASSTPLLYDSSHYFNIGQYGGNNNYFNGDIADVAVSPSALTPTQVQTDASAIYQSAYDTDVASHSPSLYYKLSDWAPIVVAPPTTGTPVPAISGSTVEPSTLSSTAGTFGGGAAATAYQWQRCNSTCSNISGATTNTYTTSASDVGDTIQLIVTASNNNGKVSETSAATSLITGPSHTQTIDNPNSLNAVSCVPATTDCVASDSQGNAFYSTNVSATAAATWSTWTGPGTSPSEAVTCPTTSLCLLAAGSDSGFGGNLYYATSFGGAWSLAYSPAYGVDAISCVSSSFCVDGQDNLGYFRYSTSPASSSWTLEQQGSATQTGVFCVSTSFCAMADNAGNVHVAISTSQIESASWTLSDVDGTSVLNGVACTSTTSCVVVDNSGNAISLAINGLGTATATKHNIDGTNSLTAVTCTTGSVCVAVDNVGNVFLSSNAGESWAKVLSLSDKLTSVACSSSSLCVAADTTGNLIAFQG